MNALETVNEHYRFIIAKDVAGICDKYASSPETYVILEGPRLTTMGHARIAKGWKDFCDSSLNLKSIDWTEGPFHEQHDTMAWVGGIIKLKVGVRGVEFENVFRASFILVRSGEDWKIKHEHVSVAHPDPYGIGDWLKK